MKHRKDHQSENVVAAFTEAQTAKLTGVSINQLKSWDRNGFYVPDLAYENRKRAYSRLYSFRDLVSLKVLHTLRNESRVTMKHLMEVKNTLSHIGDEMWANTTLFVLNRKVVFDNPETSKREVIVDGQGVLGIPLEVITGNMRRAADSLRERDIESIGRITKERGIAHNQQVIAGTRIPVESIREFVEAGYSAKQIVIEFPSLSIKDVEAVKKLDTAA